MFRRDKVLLIRGLLANGLTQRITIAPSERVNVDHVAAITALRYPDCWPPELGCEIRSLADLEKNILNFVKALYQEDRHHVLIAEYGRLMQDRGPDSRVVFGSCLNLPWLYQMVKVFHKGINQRVVDVTLTENAVVVDGVSHGFEQAVDLLRENPEIF